MALEATIICLDNSEWSRDGDYPPNRWVAQQEAANMIAGSKTESNPNNSVGIICMGGPRVEVLVAPTNDVAQILTAVHCASIKGKSDVYTSLKISQLALKNRPNKDQRQRIVVFVCSPVYNETSQLVELGRNLRRNNIAIDIICFGNTDSKEKLEELQKAANNGDNSHLVVVPSGFGVLVDSLMNTPIMNPGGAGGPAGAFEEYGGFDPNVDPELAHAMRLSLEEAKRKQEEEQNAPQEMDIDEENEEELLKRAKEMSLQEEEKKETQPNTDDKPFLDQDFVSNLLGNLEGVDLQDPSIQAMLQNMPKNEDAPEEKPSEDEKKEDKE